LVPRLIDHPHDVDSPWLLAAATVSASPETLLVYLRRYQLDHDSNLSLLQSEIFRLPGLENLELSSNEYTHGPRSNVIPPNNLLRLLSICVGGGSDGIANLLSILPNPKGTLHLERAAGLLDQSSFSSPSIQILLARMLSYIHTEHSQMRRAPLYKYKLVINQSCPILPPIDTEPSLSEYYSVSLKFSGKYTPAAVLKMI
jgi:hypothetical protein